MGNFFNKVNDNELSDFKIWQNIDDPSFIYPEKSLEKNTNVNIGLALPGGGLRTCTNTLGVLLALHKLDLLKQINYISCNSGSSWAIGPLVYSDVDLDKFLGEYIKPENLTINTLNKINEDNFASLLPDINFDEILMKNFINNKNNIEDFWSKTIAELFLKKYNLDSFNILPNNRVLVKDSPCVNKSEKSKYEYRSIRKDIPFPIINSCIYFDNIKTLSQLEFTPLYYGVPHRVKINDNLSIGSTLMEPELFTAVNNIDEANKLSKIININKSSVKFNNPKNIISIAKQIGSSSTAIPVCVDHYLPNNLIKKLDLPLINFYDPNNYFNSNAKITDGMYLDNTGLLSLLRRNVEKIILSDCLQDIDIEYDNISNCLNLKYAKYFGRTKSSDPKATIYGYNINDYNAFSKVFDSNKYNEFCINYNNFKDENNKIIFKMSLDVKENKLSGIRGGYNVKIIFIFTTKNDNFMNNLPEETRNLINSDNNDNLLSKINIKNVSLKNFPNIPIIYLNYSKILVNLKIQIAADLIMNNSQFIIKVLNDN
jgi:hypothetical protein